MFARILTKEAKSKFWCLKILTYKRYYKSVMGKIDKILQPEFHNIFFKYDRLFEKYLTELQNLKLIITYREFANTISAPV